MPSNSKTTSSVRMCTFLCTCRRYSFLPASSRNHFVPSAMVCTRTFCFSSLTCILHIQASSASMRKTYLLLFQPCLHSNETLTRRHRVCLSLPRLRNSRRRQYRSVPRLLLLCLVTDPAVCGNRLLLQLLKKLYRNQN